MVGVLVVNGNRFYSDSLETTATIGSEHEPQKDDLNPSRPATSSAAPCASMVGAAQIVPDEKPGVTVFWDEGVPWSGAALAVALSGAVGSLACMFRAARHQNSYVPLLLFTLWVLSPFAAMMWAYTIARRWSPGRQLAVGVVTPLFTVASFGNVRSCGLRASTGQDWICLPGGAVRVLGPFGHRACRCSRIAAAASNWPDVTWLNDA